jgi:hypothetical protein
MSTPKFNYIARFEMVDNIPPMRRLATITGLASQDAPVNFSNLVIPEYIMHSDGHLYQVAYINYAYIDQVETIVGQPNRVYGAFSKNHPAFNVAGQVAGLTGTLTLPKKTLISVGSNSFESQSGLRGNLTVAGLELTRIGDKCFFNAFAGGRRLVIMARVAPSVGQYCYSGTSFFPIDIRNMTNDELAEYAL